eukprot:m.67398 g.67398  ORF g.67398 m.67398 type:complete len:201 (+) comp8216_c0_seq4:305-907(+)
MYFVYVFINIFIHTFIHSLIHTCLHCHECIFIQPNNNNNNNNGLENFNSDSSIIVLKENKKYAEDDREEDHVVVPSTLDALGVECLVYDFDSKLPFPTPLEDYLHHTAPEDTPLILKQKYRIVPSKDLLTHFSSDRTHMLDEDGSYLKPPPDYPPIKTQGIASNLMRYVDMTHSDQEKGHVCESSKDIGAYLLSLLTITH